MWDGSRIVLDKEQVNGIMMAIEDAQERLNEARCPPNQQAFLDMQAAAAEADNTGLNHEMFLKNIWQAMKLAEDNYHVISLARIYAQAAGGEATKAERDAAVDSILNEYSALDYWDRSCSSSDEGTACPAAAASAASSSSDDSDSGGTLLDCVSPRSEDRDAREFDSRDSVAVERDHFASLDY
ncbi:hypothetical protein JL722_8650 [Aureococcus anophagefferens]|nr:hypothetical protein JL722_8650 [Aureococcus anophagefferens]